MTRKPLYVALSCALGFSILAKLAQAGFGYANTHQLPHPEWLEVLTILVNLPGAFVAMMLFGMCNCENLQGWTVTIFCNALLYTLPFVLYASIYELSHRNETVTPEAPVANHQH